MSEFRYDVYLSFPNQQMADADAVRDALRLRGWKVFSRQGLLPGDDWAARESAALAASRFVVIFMSGAYFANDSLTAESSEALKRERREQKVVVLPLLFENTNVPFGLDQKIWIDFRYAWTGDEKFHAGISRLDEALRTHSHADAIPSISVPDDLIRACVSGGCVLFAGGGLSARAGCRTWNQSLLDILRYAQETKAIDASYARSMAAALEEGERNSVADGISQVIGREALQDFLRSYDRNTDQHLPVSPAHETLRGIPFSAMVTTNYDHLLEETYSEVPANSLFTMQDSGALLDALSQKRPFILKLYGSVDRAETLIFAPIEYRAAVSSNIPFSKFMEGIFFSRTFFFLGLSLEGIQDFLSGFVFRGISPRKHFALVAVSGSAWKAKADLLLRRYNIEVIPFRISETYADMDTFLQDLRNAMPVRDSALAASQAGAPTPGIRRLSLSNIGPFERLDIDFQKDQNWKVLLGDNGVGKSTILKAIAVAMMGSDARAFAGRLVRSGQTKGQITLYTEANPSPGYVTEILTKDVLSEADVVSIPSRPMEAEGWLALGFSALRVVTWSSPGGPQPIVQKGRPTPDDLLPLISGEIDPRMDRLKQWIINLDAVEKSGPALTLSGHEGGVRSILFSPDGRTLISGSTDGTIRFWDCWNGTLSRTITAHNAGVNSIAISADGKVLASGSYDRLARTWSMSGGLINSFSDSQTQIMSVALDVDGSSLITASESGGIRIWDPSGEVARHWNPDGGAIWCIAPSPNYSVLASGTYSGKIYLRSVSTGKHLRSIAVGRGAIMDLAWSPDGRQLFCGSKNGPAEVWDTESGVKIREFPASDTTAIALSLDGRVIASGSNTGEVKVWDAESGTELMRTRAHFQTIWSIALSPNGRTVASASEDRTVKLWNLPGSMPAKSQGDTIRRFFEILGGLMDRTDIEYQRVTDDFRVMVRTDDAPAGVPLELLSQGMTSLFGWIGVLCQRLKETLEAPTQDPLPTNSFAMVLIDELDAHMHPAWQYVLVSRLTKAFPRVQFIATTHSPLIAADLPPDSIFLLRREDGEIRWGFDREARRIQGLRVDQILTSELFGLNEVRGATVDKQQSRYIELALKTDRTTGEEAELARVAEHLQHYRVRPEETREAHEASRLIEESLDAKVNDSVHTKMDESSKQKLLEEIRAQMLELKTPFRRDDVGPP